jgi:trehalose 6-phosphate synthase
MQSALQENGGIWFGWSGKVSDPPGPPTELTEGGITYVTVDLPRSEFDAYYNGFANRTLWPLLHYRLDLVDYRRDTYRGYQRVNRTFARLLAPMIRDDDLVWVQDYHLMPLAALLREEGVTARIGFFLHTPLPPPDLIVALPGHRALMEALTDFDLVGFQTEGDRQSCIDYLRDLAGGSTTYDDYVTMPSGTRTLVRAIPISIDRDLVSQQAVRAAQQVTVRRLRDSLLGKWLIIGVDRLDYSKGLHDRFVAFGRFLDRHAEHRKQAVMLQIAPTSRGEVPEYRAIRADLERQSGAVNGRFSDADWVPLRYVNRTYTQGTLAGFYRAARVGLVTPLRDGMNLVAKEYVAAQDPDDPGVLILSSFAGAARELESAIIVNPYDIDGVAEAVHRAITMTLPERRRRWHELDEVLRKWTIADWREAYLTALAGTRPASGVPAGQNFQ